MVIHYCELNPNQPLPKGLQWCQTGRPDYKNIMRGNGDILLVYRNPSTEIYDPEDFLALLEIAEDEGAWGSW